MNIYTYKLALAPHYYDLKNWDARTQEILGLHASYLKAGLGSGKVLVVGRTDTKLENNFGIAVFKAANEFEAREFMEADPVIKHGIMTAEVFPFKLLMVTDEAKNFNVW